MAPFQIVLKLWVWRAGSSRVIEWRHVCSSISPSSLLVRQKSSDFLPFLPIVALIFHLFPVCLRDSVLAFHKHGLQGRSFHKNVVRVCSKKSGSPLCWTIYQTSANVLVFWASSVVRSFEPVTLSNIVFFLQALVREARLGETFAEVLGIDLPDVLVKKGVLVLIFIEDSGSFTDYSGDIWSSKYLSTLGIWQVSFRLFITLPFLSSRVILAWGLRTCPCEWRVRVRFRAVTSFRGNKRRVFLVFQNNYCRKPARRRPDVRFEHFRVNWACWLFLNCSPKTESLSLPSCATSSLKSPCEAIAVDVKPHPFVLTPRCLLRFALKTEPSRGDEDDIKNPTASRPFYVSAWNHWGERSPIFFCFFPS